MEASRKGRVEKGEDPGVISRKTVESRKGKRTWCRFCGRKVDSSRKKSRFIDVGTLVRTINEVETKVLCTCNVETCDQIVSAGLITC